MKRHLVPLLLGAAVLVAGCGTAAESAVDRAGGSPSPVTHPHPTAMPWPAYDVPDYTYTLRTSCFCADRGSPVVVTVRDGEVTYAVYAHRGWGHAAGDRADDWMRLSINDVIDAANDRHAAQVRVVWPEDQDHPASVWIDHDAGVADDEVGYTIRGVVPE